MMRFGSVMYQKLATFPTAQQWICIVMASEMLPSLSSGVIKHHVIGHWDVDIYPLNNWIIPYMHWTLAMAQIWTNIEKPEVWWRCCSPAPRWATIVAYTGWLGQEMGRAAGQWEDRRYDMDACVTQVLIEKRWIWRHWRPCHACVICEPSWMLAVKFGDICKQHIIV